MGVRDLEDDLSKKTLAEKATPSAVTGIAQGTITSVGRLQPMQFG
jgi:hypothetical protein